MAKISAGNLGRVFTVMGAVAACATLAPDKSIANAVTPSFCQGATYIPDINDNKCKLSTGMAFLPCTSGTPMYPGGHGYAYDLQNPRPCGVRRCGFIFAVRCGQQTGTISCYVPH